MTRRALRVLYGGTFDPVHLGHVAAVDDVLERTGCDALDLVPCRISPLKDWPGAGPDARCAMLERALAGRERAFVDRRELDRDGPSWSVTTLASVREEVGPDMALGWVLGSDALAELDRWHRWRELPELAHLLVLDRPGAPLPTDGPVARLIAERGIESAADLRRAPAGGIWRVGQRPVDVSASAVRDALARGPDGWQQAGRLLPREVWEYIRVEGLYGVVQA